MCSDASAPTVSVVCATYNHEQYITRCLEGILRQQTPFRFEVIVHDDASTDATQAVVHRFAEQHENTVFPVVQTENQYSKGVRPFWSYLWPRARGRYIAVCEGDDFWTDPYKLVKQVEAMEAHTCLSASCHLVAVCDADGVEIDRQRNFPKGISRLATLGDILEGNFVSTCSLMFRAHSAVPFPSWAGALRNGDWVLHVLNAMRGDILCIPEVMAAYRKHPGGQWTGRSIDQQLADISDRIDALRAFDLETEGQHSADVERGITSARFTRALTLVNAGHPRMARDDAWYALTKAAHLRRVPFTHTLDIFARAAAPGLRRMITLVKQSS